MNAIRVLLLGAFVTSAGCAAIPPEQEQYTTYALSQEEAQQVEAGVLRELEVADGLFVGLRAVKSASGSSVVCGWVRVRSDDFEYARYPDNRPFAVTYMEGPEGIQNFRLVYFANVKSESPPLYNYCSQRGIVL